MDYEAIAREIMLAWSDFSEETRTNIVTILRAHFEPKAEPGQDAKDLAEAWEKCKTERITKDWTMGMSFNYQAFFTLGWDASKRSRTKMTEAIGNLRSALASSPREDDKHAN
jgi:hypothetical protein